MSSALDVLLAIRYPLWPGRLSYRLRPYDMLADGRRWAWQKRQRCGLPPMTPDAYAALIRAIEANIKNT